MEPANLFYGLASLAIILYGVSYISGKVSMLTEVAKTWLVSSLWVLILSVVAINICISKDGVNSCSRLTHSGVDHLIHACESALAYIGVTRAEVELFLMKATNRASEWFLNLKEVPQTQ